jgi:hypothetical protein
MRRRTAGYLSITRVAKVFGRFGRWRLANWANGRAHHVPWLSRYFDGHGFRRHSKQAGSRNAFQARKTYQQLVGTRMVSWSGSELMFRLEAGPDRPAALGPGTD